eukprot:CAMPEP_0196587430 /NCGR_PEP_ID=MMETSP1081-20130531/57470_1 /TAXON_ID=36882 /ORGANISM="Pyramimonas amylifera, Strain CCMP720" /LENGTH=145 /DNA_ID=CAMNT_0041909617 /DNA_START=288 /DNA_END=726 /DNA_ORIENTATION=-
MASIYIHKVHSAILEVIGRLNGGVSEDNSSVSKLLHPLHGLPHALLGTFQRFQVGSVLILACNLAPEVNHVVVLYFWAVHDVELREPSGVNPELHCHLEPLLVEQVRHEASSGDGGDGQRALRLKGGHAAALLLLTGPWLRGGTG